MRRPDVAALVTGALVGALVALGAVLIWTAASRPAGFPTAVATLPSPFTASSPTPRPEFPITLERDGLGLSSFGEDGEAVVGALSELLGPRNSDERWTCPDPPGEVHFSGWADLGIFVMDGVFVGWTDAVHYPPEYGPLLGLKTTEDLHIGLMLEHFEAHLGDRFAFTEPGTDAADGDARAFEIDGPTGIHGLVEDGPDGPRVIALSAGTTCFEDGP